MTKKMLNTNCHIYQRGHYWNLACGSRNQKYKPPNSSSVHFGIDVERVTIRACQILGVTTTLYLATF